MMGLGLSSMLTWLEMLYVCIFFLLTCDIFFCLPNMSSLL
jgi:hypothetical protein